MSESADIKIQKGYPPNVRDIEMVLPVFEERVFAYYPFIYNPSGKKLDEDLLLHEHIHLFSQQRIGVEEWWRRYLLDTEFRYQEELIAFAAQLGYGLRSYPRRVADMMLRDFSLLLCGKEYQTGRYYHEVETALRRKAKEYATSEEGRKKTQEIRRYK